ncbi:uncharacterized protein LOC136088240 [Hydra vulgaris]|uniref:Uncharacterized protein LOC136088240 n=1 Tax=Hydra vulgaris TaxID=6087 RepID=A0ABM4D199_HYDVU
MQRVISGEMKKWRDILKVIVDAILFCAKNNLALQGTTEDIGQQNSCIFLSLIELISHYYPLVAEHIASVKAKKTKTSYFSPRIQNELIELLGQKVRNEILSNIKEAKYYSTLFECTPDASHKDQMTQIISQKPFQLTLPQKKKKKIKGSKASIKNLRYVGVDNIIKDATKKANQSGIDGGFPIKRKRKVKRMALYEAEDDSHLLTAEAEFGSQCNLVFDSIITQIEWRL